MHDALTCQAFWWVSLCLHAGQRPHENQQKTILAWMAENSKFAVFLLHLYLRTSQPLAPASDGH